jgi:serine/threonine-protein kinase
MACLDANSVAAYVEGALSSGEAQQVSEHLSACAECRSLVAILQAGGETPDPLVGQVLADTYRLVHSLGSGGMGTVYAAEHVRLGRRVAVKVLRPDLRQHPEVVERFKREAQICSTLGSRHIIDVLDFNQARDGTLYMVMELLRGEDLAQRLALTGPLPPPTVVQLLEQVCEALACTHDEGILHRDLKPSNIFLCEGELLDVKVLDFGVSKALGALTTLTGTNEMLGTPLYMSPEMASARPHLVDPRSDLFALGAIAYEALCGERAFEADSIPAVLYRIVHDDPTPPHVVSPSVPVPLSLLVMQLLRKDREERLGSARQLADTLHRLSSPATGPGGQAFPLTPVPDRDRGASRDASRESRWGIAAFVVTVLALAAAAGATYVWHQRGAATRTRPPSSAPTARSTPLVHPHEAGTSRLEDRKVERPAPKLPATRPTKKRPRKPAIDKDPLL